MKFTWNTRPRQSISSGMKTLKECIREAEEKKVAIGHFNVATLDMVWAVFNAAKKLGVPVVVGAAEGEQDFMGLPQIVAMVKSIREEYNYPIFINADHTYSFERVKKAIDAGVDSVVFDGAQLSYEENLAVTKQCVEYARQKGNSTLVEAELGFIGVGSEIKEKLPEGVSEATMTKPDEAKKFVEETGIDLLAPSVGNIHGKVKGGNPALHPERVREVREAVGIPLVLHGGSGSSDEDFKKVIAAGISMIHISTDLRVAYKESLKASINTSEEVAPYKYLKPAKEEIEKVVERYLRLFNNL